MKKIFLLAILAALLLTGLACFNEKGGGSAVEASAKAEPAPDFSVISLDGQQLSLASLKGKVILVNFWATWCPPCRAEIPEFIEAYTELKDRGLEILGFSVDDMPEAELKSFVTKAKMNYPVALVGQDIVSAFRPGQYIPTSIFIDRNGRLRYKHVGQLAKKDLVRIFEELEKE
ncbi:MAG: TlpA family protein disulfide reductase [Candidatus Saccharicenans sp.]|jgi:cytochrome c biogenesis protein CcmG/thiol:disulfide interchange protein DsbE|nr:TlpA family protein disulfide reductase [Candidatus Saccharicenans sp.]